jgi:hypothetical protein
MAASLADLIALQRGKTWHGVTPPAFRPAPPAPPPPAPPAPTVPDAPTVPTAPTEAQRAALDAAFAQLDEMTARCDALIERHGVWTRYVTGGES